MRQIIRTATGVLAVVALSVIAAPLAVGASPPKPRFKAQGWKVFVLDSTDYPAPHKVKVGRTYTMCNMDRLNTLEIDYSYRNAATHGSPYTLTISGPGGSEKARFGTPKRQGVAHSAWGSGALPPESTTPTEAGKYTVTIRQGSKKLMRASITLSSTNTCS